jgi:hypothetical protein
MKNLIRTLVTTLVVTVAPVAITASVPAPAEAALPACNKINEGKIVRKRTSFDRSWLIKQLDFDENYTGSKTEMVFELQKTSAVTDSVSAHASVTAKMKAGAFADLEATAGVEMGRIGETVEFAKATVKKTYKSGDRYFYARGGMFFKATYKWYKCTQIQNSGFDEYTWTVRKGTAKGYVMGRSTTGCQVKTDRGSMAKYIQKTYC